MITLRQLVGKKAVNGRMVEVALDLDQILKKDETKRNGFRRLGFISRHDGAGIVFHPGLTPGEMQEARDAVSELRKKSKDWQVADKFSSPATPPVEETEDEDE